MSLTRYEEVVNFNEDLPQVANLEVSTIRIFNSACIYLCVFIWSESGERRECMNLMNLSRSGLGSPSVLAQRSLSSVPDEQ